MIRPLRDEVERYGHYSLAAESMYDHPFQWGSKRTGPDLARVGGKYSDDWQRASPERSALGGAGIDHAALCLPGEDRRSTHAHRSGHEGASRVGVPYTDEMIAKAPADLQAQATTDDAGRRLISKRYPKAQARDFDGDPERITEMDALIAYLQMLGTLVDFKIYDDKANMR